MTFCVPRLTIPGVGVLLVGMVTIVFAQAKAPTDWSDWQKYRAQVRHPAAAIKAVDIERARGNIQRHEWAKRYVKILSKRANRIAKKVTPDYLRTMLERTTPGCVGPCPACRAKGLPWHPNGQWSWSASRPDQLTCRVCKTVFPSDEFPESIVLQSTWDPVQKFGFIGGETFRCFGYRQARPSISGIIRARKVGHVISQLHELGLAYALTEEPEYARAAKAIFLRLAVVFPKYLVRAGYGYGEYSDCDPHVAAQRISDLPVDELVYPPNKPNRKLFAGYWAASRLGTSGMDGAAVSRMAEAYDLTCTAEEDGQPVYTEQQRALIERDVLLESAYLATCDDRINNKSVGNRAGAAMVGMVVGHPGLVRFGLDGFKRTVEEWFLPDGGTSESSAYAMMTMSGIHRFAFMFRDYSDLPGYVGPDGQRLERFDACRDTRYGDCWQDLIWTLQGNLRHPPSADSYRTTRIAASYAELVAVAYPTVEHIAFLKELAGTHLEAGSPEQAIFYREPDLATRDVTPFSLPDIVFPYLSQGYLRTGPLGRKSVALLNASNWGVHHHSDSLDLYYWKDGRELLSDLGYLWDHPDSQKTKRTFAHNLVMLDGREQTHQGRGGSFQLFAITPHVKVMEASSKAYAKASVYRRTCVQIDHGDAGSYLLDIFRVQGGGTQQYVFHGPNTACTVEGLNLVTPDQPKQRTPFAVRFHLPQVSEIFVDDVEIRQMRPDGSEGENIAPNPSVDEGVLGNSPPGWGLYTGDGSADCTVAEPGRTGAYCARLQALKPHANGRMNVAMLAGKSDGYRGENAISGLLGAKYTLRFRLRGSAARVNVDVVLWPHNPSSADDRVHIGVIQLAATEHWRQYEATFTLPDGTLPLENVREGSGEKPWRITWALAKEHTFSAFSPGDNAETVRIGDGWGQRDHRNSDRGAKLPYIVRRVEGPGLTSFVSVFAAARNRGTLVRGVTRLAFPKGAPPSAVAVEVKTTRGVDVICSMTAPAPVTLATALGQLQTDARLAVVLGSGTKANAACLVGGTALLGSGICLKCDRSVYGGTVRGAGSTRGESYFILQGDLPEQCNGHTLVVQDGAIRRAYPIRDVALVDGQQRVFTKKDNVGFGARKAETWELLPVAVVGEARH